MRTRRLAILAVLAGAGVVVLAGTRTWVLLDVAGVAGGPGTSHVTAAGRDVAPAATALAFVAFAGVVVLATARPVMRRVAAGLLALAGAGALAAVAPLLTRGGANAAILPAFAAATGTLGGLHLVIGDARLTAWPWVGAAGALLIVAGGGLALLRGGGWSGPSRRFEPVGPSPAATGSGGTTFPDSPDAALDAWDALSRGEDPTS